jgi:hypothetical protein
LNQQNDLVFAYRQAFDDLSLALKRAPTEQINLLASVDSHYAAMDDANAVLSEQQVLDGQIMIRHAESILTRYFGM